MGEDSFWVQWRQALYTMLLYHSNTRLSCLEVNELAIWLVMEPVWGRAALLQGSFMKITFWAGRDHFGKYTTCQINTAFLIYLESTNCSNVYLFRFSVSNDLKYDAERDLRDIGAKNIQVHSLNKVRSKGDEGNRITLFGGKTSSHRSIFFSVQIWKNLI